jgi:hypothetical protein
MVLHRLSATTLVRIDVVFVTDVLEQVSQLLVDEQRYADCLDRCIAPSDIVNTAEAVDVVNELSIAGRSPNRHRRNLEVVVKNLGPTPSFVPLGSPDRRIVAQELISCFPQTAHQRSCFFSHLFGNLHSGKILSHLANCELVLQCDTVAVVKRSAALVLCTVTLHRYEQRLRRPLTVA